MFSNSKGIDFGNNECLGEFSVSSFSVESLEAEIQAQVGEFLGMKRNLITMTKSRNSDISEPASELYTNQINIEKQLQIQLAVIEELKSGDFNLDKITALGTFVYTLHQHMSEVRNLTDKYNKTVKEKDTVNIAGIEITTFQAIMLGFALIRVASGLRKRK